MKLLKNFFGIKKKHVPLKERKFDNPVLDMCNKLNPPWDCPDCGAERWGFQTQCLKCGYERPEEEWSYAAIEWLREREKE